MSSLFRVSILIVMAFPHLKGQGRACNKMCGLLRGMLYICKVTVWEGCTMSVSTKLGEIDIFSNS